MTKAGNGYSPGVILLEHICQQCFRGHWKWHDCLNKDNWYTPSAIFYCSHQMLWGILNLNELEEGDWPSEHKDTGYVGNQGAKSTGTKFLLAAQFYAEITARLRTTGEAGEALVDEVQGGETDFERLSRPAKRALRYISIWRRRRQTYSQWKATQKHNRCIVFNKDLTSSL